MIHEVCLITKIEAVNPTITKIKFQSQFIANSAKEGQFVNIRIDETSVPLLRRPFSIYYTTDKEVEIVFGIMGMGTNKLNHKQVGDTLDVIGPLGKPFNLDDGEDISILVGGGLGAAPLPMLYRSLQQKNKQTVIFLGARNKNYLLKNYLQASYISTDDGSEGYKGNIVTLLENYLSKSPKKNYKIYACGPTQMLIELIKVANKYKVKCEVSLETMMACGIGICQGCAVKYKNSTKKYALSCVDGPIFNANDIEL
ncbi:MAG: Dihydroorotate dehydrogenase electron transfer subunit [Ignavibacteriae bacterium]|nr:MAG: Dihydroorotate dehydrogenase electron transfer subunit [Ignavibacteriota bacterium]